MLGKEGVWPPSFRPLLEGRQHALRPNAGFDPRPPGLDLSGLFSPYGHYRRFCFPASVCHASTFLPPFTPRPLQALHRYYEGSDSCPALLHRTGLPASRARPSDHSISNHLTCPHRSFVTLLSSVDLPLSRVQTSPITSRLAGHVRPNRVRHPTDWSFTSCCFPPRLTATQFRSVKGLSVYLKGTFTPLTTHACRRTGAGVPPAHAGVICTVRGLSRQTFSSPVRL